MSNDLLEWIETFYKDLEVGFGNYTRPTDYIERALRVLNGNRNTVKNQSDKEEKKCTQ